MSPEPQSAQVVVRIAPAVNNHSSQVGTVTSLGGEADRNYQDGVGGVIAERNLYYYVPMAVGTTQSSEEGGQGDSRFSPSDLRGTKRVHEFDAENDRDTSRKHGKRLTTKEEVSLFEICNRHADSFGKRSDICNWWKTIAEEFTRAHGRPYSWHSVRRKVEVVTKQRVKFLEDQRQRQQEVSGAHLVEDLMNPQWCAVLDSWIPTWQRWEEAEARRIAKRDEIIRRRSQSKPGPDQWKLSDQTARRSSILSPTRPDGHGGDTAHSFPSDGFSSIGDSTPMTDSVPAPNAKIIHPTPTESPPISASTSVKLPPGFETMFTSNTRPIREPIPPPLSESATQIASDNDISTNTRLFSAVLDTLGKLNRHLDAASGDGSADSRFSPMISALVQAASESPSHIRFTPQAPSHQTNMQRSSSVDLERIKEELRQEMRAELRRELDRERAALEEKLNSLQRTQEAILEMLRQEPA